MIGYDDQSTLVLQPLSDCQAWADKSEWAVGDEFMYRGMCDDPPGEDRILHSSDRWQLLIAELLTYGVQDRPQQHCYPLDFAIPTE